LLSERQRASRSARPFSLVLIDLDKFKEVNDGLGHLEGDLVLARVGRLLEQKCRQSNVVARYGGDEFVILMPETGAEQAQVLAERLRLWLSSDPMLSEHHITGSFGVASYPVHGLSAEDILRVADAGMYVSKHAGGDRVSVADEFAQGETTAIQRQLIGGYIDGFLHRENPGPQNLEELVSTLKKLSHDEEDPDLDILRDSIEAMSRTAESRESHNSGHGEMVGRYAEIIGQALELSPEESFDLAYAGRVHDVGKILIPERLLNKQGPLSDEEYARLKEHAHMGAEIVGTIPGSEMMKKAIEYHHEAFDGTGYPSGLRGEEIPLWARILAIADAYVNLTTDRALAPGKTSETSLEEMEKLSGVRYDGMLVRILMRELRGEKPHRFKKDR
jgi:diguanylate cyclase (GGDEF)-like protein